MKFAFLSVLIAVNGLSAGAAPNSKHQPGPKQCGSALVCKSLAVLTVPDKALKSKLTNLADSYRKQLFDSGDGQQILNRSKVLAETYMTLVTINNRGYIKGDRRFGFIRAASGPKTTLESDIDLLIDKKWNHPNVLAKPLQRGCTFALEIWPNGTADVYPMSFLKSAPAVFKHTQRSAACFSIRSKSRFSSEDVTL